VAGMTRKPTSAAAETASAVGFEYPVRIYYEDTDSGGVVYYANYLKFFERARTEWLRSAGISQQQLSQDTGLIFVVRSTALEYHAPARLDDALAVISGVARMGRVSVDFEQQIWRGTANHRELLASGHIKVGCVHRETLRPTPFPEMIRLALGVTPTIKKNE